MGGGREGRGGTSNLKLANFQRSYLFRSIFLSIDITVNGRWLSYLLSNLRAVFKHFGRILTLENMIEHLISSFVHPQS